MAIVFPTDPGAQTPVNTFSPTSTPVVNTTNNNRYLWNGVAWTVQNDSRYVNIGGDTMTGTLNAPAMNITSKGSVAGYQRGTWVPYWSEAATGLNLFQNNDLTIYGAEYVRTGDMVWVNCYIKNDESYSYDNGLGTSTEVGVSGLPFPTISTPSPYGGYFSAYVGYFLNFNGWTGGYSVSAYFSRASSTINLVYATVNGMTAVTAATAGSPNSTIMISGSYLTSDTTWTPGNGATVD